jgi:phage repressor protein C with HTH and peptisase S24 domain
MDTLAKRVKFARKFRKLSQDQLAELSGLRQPDISKIERGEILKTTGLLALARALQCSPNWLDTGDGESGLMTTEGKLQRPDELVIPQFETGGSMGSGLILRDQPGLIRGWNVNQEWVSKNIKNHTGTANLCIVTGFGDSMKGMFNSGDPLVVDRGVNSVEYDAVYFFRVADEGFIKRLQRIPGEGLRVLSENTKYESWTIKPEMDFEVFGRVLKAWQGEDF